MPNQTSQRTEGLVPLLGLDVWNMHTISSIKTKDLITWLLGGMSSIGMK